MRNSLFITKLIVDAETGVGTNTPTVIAVTPVPAGRSGAVNVLVLADGSITAGAIVVGNANPLAYLAWSNDAGHTWSASYSTSMGVQAAYGTRLIWRRLGKARERVFKLGISAGVKKVIISAHVEAGV
jgi:hypothetical protein